MLTGSVFASTNNQLCVVILITLVIYEYAVWTWDIPHREALWETAGEMNRIGARHLFLAELTFRGHAGIPGALLGVQGCEGEWGRPFNRTLVLSVFVPLSYLAHLDFSSIF